MGKLYNCSTCNVKRYGKYLMGVSADRPGVYTCKPQHKCLKPGEEKAKNPEPKKGKKAKEQPKADPAPVETADVTTLQTGNPDHDIVIISHVPQEYLTRHAAKLKEYLTMWGTVDWVKPMGGTSSKAMAKFALPKQAYRAAAEAHNPEDGVQIYIKMLPDSSGKTGTAVAKDVEKTKSRHMKKVELLKKRSVAKRQEKAKKREERKKKKEKGEKVVAGVDSDEEDGDDRVPTAVPVAAAEGKAPKKKGQGKKEQAAEDGPVKAKDEAKKKVVKKVMKKASKQK